MSLKRLFFPIFAETGLKYLMGTVNIYLVSILSDQAVAAATVATQMLQIELMLFFMLGNGVTVVMCQQLGAGDEKKARDYAVLSIYLCVLVAIASSAAMVCFAPQFMRLMRLEQSLVPDALAYLRITSAFSIFQAVFTVLSAIMRSYGKVRLVMFISLFMNVLNAVGGWLVVRGWLAPPLVGVAGIAIVRVGSECISLLLMIALIRRNGLIARIGRIPEQPWRRVAEILRVALPAGVESVSYNIAQTITTAIIAVLGSAAISAKSYVTNIVNYVYVLGLSLSSASSILIGRYVGAGDYENAIALNRRCLRVTLLANGALSVACFLLRYQLLGIFTADPVILQAASAILFIDIFVEIGRGLNHVQTASLRAASDVRAIMVANLSTCWGCSILFSYLLGIKAGWGLTGCWIAYGMDELLRGTYLSLRWRSGKWKSAYKRMQARS